VNSPPQPSSLNLQYQTITFTEDVVSKVPILLNASDVDPGDFPTYTQYEVVSFNSSAFSFADTTTSKSIVIGIAATQYVPYDATTTHAYPISITYSTPVLNYNTPVNGPFTWCWELGCFNKSLSPTCAIRGQATYRNGFLTCYNMNISAVNDAPTINCDSTPGCVNYPAYNNTILDLYDIDINDVDCPSGFTGCGNYSFSLTLVSGPGKIWLPSISGLYGFTNTSTSIYFNAPLPVLRATFTAGFFYYAAVSSATMAYLNVTVNDNGNYGSGGPLVASKLLTITVSIGQPPTNYSYAAPVSGALLGGTGIFSSGVYMLYRAMKKRKMLPEDANPWEADEGFDNTLDNPLYTGTPTTSSATRVTLVTRD